MKVKAIQFVPLGRPPKKGEWMIDTSGWPDKAVHDHSGDTAWQAVERREVEVEVEDPVPAWIDAAMDKFIPREDRAEGGCKTIVRLMAEAYRAHVEERVKAAAALLVSARRESKDGGDDFWPRVADIIREEFLK